VDRVCEPREIFNVEPANRRRVSRSNAWYFEGNVRRHGVPRVQGDWQRLSGREDESEVRVLLLQDLCEGHKRRSGVSEALSDQNVCQ
jgi:hypothetical protein